MKSAAKTLRAYPAAEVLADVAHGDVILPDVAAAGAATDLALDWKWSEKSDVENRRYPSGRRRSAARSDEHHGGADSEVSQLMYDGQHYDFPAVRSSNSSLFLIWYYIVRRTTAHP